MKQGYLFMTKDQSLRRATLRILSTRRLLATGLIGLGLAGDLGIAGAVHAQYAACRSDPVITLSDGSSGSIYETIQDATTDIKSITYQIHIPVGLKVVSVQYSGDVPATQQSLTWTADNPAGKFDEYVTVKTGVAKAQMTAYAASSSGTKSLQVSGNTNTTLHLHIG